MESHEVTQPKEQSHTVYCSAARMSLASNHWRRSTGNTSQTMTSSSRSMWCVDRLSALGEA